MQMIQTYRHDSDAWLSGQSLVLLTPFHNMALLCPALAEPAG
jgi:hypothetical protein